MKLPDDLDELRSDAVGEGYRFVERLVNDWDQGKLRFDGPDEVLLVARKDEAIAGIGGISADPFDPAALRMRRFYVRPCFRRTGIAQELVRRLMANSLNSIRRIHVNAGTEVAPNFWERLGFTAVQAEHHTHEWRRDDA